MSKYIAFIIGSQHLYGSETLEIINNHGNEMTNYFNERLPIKIEYKQLVTLSSECQSKLSKLQADENCLGLIVWMHTFSPSKLWIAGLKLFNKPILHLHTQYNEGIPWSTIDMDYMNLNQAAHGDREHGHIYARLNKYRTIISGYWQDLEIIAEIKAWQQIAQAIHNSKKLKVIRFGDNMRDVAVTEGDKIEAQIKFGWEVDGYGVGKLVQYIEDIPNNEVEAKYQELITKYELDTTNIDSVKYQIKQYLGMKKFLIEKDAQAFTDTFEDLTGLKQLPGLATQLLMQDGYGFGGEGDWKTAAFTYLMKSICLENQCASFMEDYTYHLTNGAGLVLGSHMLEVCPSISATKPKIQVHHLGIGGKEAPARLVFLGKTDNALQISLIDIGTRFRIIVNKVKAMKPLQDMPHLPVASVMWQPLPDFKTATKAWLYAGGAHHTTMVYNISVEQIQIFAQEVNIECLVIDENTTINQFKQTLLNNEQQFR